MKQKNISAAKKFHINFSKLYFYVWNLFKFQTLKHFWSFYLKATILKILILFWYILYFPNKFFMLHFIVVQFECLQFFSNASLISFNSKTGERTFIIHTKPANNNRKSEFMALRLGYHFIRRVKLAVDFFVYENFDPNVILLLQMAIWPRS